MRTKDLIAVATSLPIEERAIVVDLILKSLTPTDSEVDRKWKEIALRRVKEIKSGKVNLVPGNEVFLPSCSRS